MQLNSPTSLATLHVLLVEDEEAHAEVIRRSFERYGKSFSIAVASSLAEAVPLLAARTFELVIADWCLPDGEGFDLLKDRPRFPLVVMTSQGSEQIAVDAMRAGAIDYIVKSEASLRDLPRIAENAIRLWTNLVARVEAQKQLLVVEEDLRERRRSEALLRESEKRLRFLADAIPQIVWTARPDGHVDYLNQQWYTLTGGNPDLTGDESWLWAFHSSDLPTIQNSWQVALQFGSVYETQVRLLDCKTGEYRWHLARALPERDSAGAIVRWMGTATDIDDHKRSSQDLEQLVEARTAELRHSLAEKTTLLQEVHHRVKNNLQVVCSLLSMQIASLGEDSSAGPLVVAHSRVLAMSLIHEQIYQSDTLADLDFAQYIEVLGDQLFVAYCVDPSRIRLVREVESIRLTIDEAIPCGLILNELLSNSLKHAFSDGHAGTIRISFRQTAARQVELRVEDNGVGLPPDFRLEASSSMGMQVVRSLAHQIRADLNFSNANGTATQLTWNRRKPAESQPAAALITRNHAGGTDDNA